MTDTQLTIVLASIPVTLTAVGALVVSIRNGNKAATIVAKVDEVHTLTNSNLSKVTAALDVANTEISGLKKLVSALAPVKRKRTKAG